MLAAGLAVALLLTVFASSPTTAKGILAADGYANAATLTHQQFMTMNSSSDAQMYGGLIGNDIALGTKGKTVEVAVELSASGKGLITVLLPAAQSPGVTMRIDGDYLVMSGSASSFNGLGNSSSPTAPATPAPASSPPASSAPTAGPVGTAFTVTTTDISGNGTATYKIRLVQVADPAAPDADMKSYDPSMYPAGTHLVGMKFRVDGVTGTAGNSPGTELNATDSTGQVYSNATAELAASMQDFSGASIGPGEHDSGWVAFQVPDSTHLVSVKYDTMAGTTVTGTLGG